MQATTRTTIRSITGICPEWVTATGIAFALLMANLVVLVNIAF